MSDEHMNANNYLKGRFINIGNIITDTTNNWQFKVEMEQTNEDSCFADTISVLTFLNMFSEENEQLRHDATVLIQANSDYRKENESLKQSLANKMDSDAWWEKKATERVEELEKENERLKTLKRCYQNNLESYVEALHEEYDKADGELKAALSVVLSKKYDCKELE